MTAQEWNECDDPQKMLKFVESTASSRKLRLFACACCRRVWHWLPDVLPDVVPDERSRQAVEVAEGHAEGEVAAEQLTAAWHAAGPATWVAPEAAEDSANSALGAAAEDPRDAARQAAFAASHARFAATNHNVPSWGAAHLDRYDHPWHAAWASQHNEDAAQAALLRDLFGPLPFRHAALDPAWLTPGVVKLAQTAYEERNLPSGQLDCGRLAVLADCLEEAGCHDGDILGHLRGTGPHVRGCWSLDLLLQRG